MAAKLRQQLRSNSCLAHSTVLFTNSSQKRTINMCK